MCLKIITDLYTQTNIIDHEELKLRNNEVNDLFEYLHLDVQKVKA